MTNADHEAYDELCCYTLSHGDPSFIHQHVVDAFAAQSFQAGDKSIRLIFALIGLHLRVEQQFRGKRVQVAHMKLGHHKRQWPVVPLPTDRGAITAGVVRSVPEGPERDRMIDRWCACVWEAFRDSHGIVAGLVQEHGLL
jgi:hypothetical protein